VQQKRYRYTGKEIDDSSGLSYYGARYLAPWLTRWISPDSARAVATAVIYFFACVTVAFLLHLVFVFASDNGSATIGVVVFVAEGLDFVIQL
jgi:RHS repeat-associated protein